MPTPGAAAISCASHSIAGSLSSKQMTPERNRPGVPIFLPSSFNQQDLALVTRRSRCNFGRWLQIIAEWDNSSPPVSETGRSWCKSKLSSQMWS